MAEKKNSNETNLDLTAWYVNIRRCLELIGSNQMYDMALKADKNDYSIKPGITQYIKDDLMDYVRNNEIKSLEMLILKDEAVPGSLFTINACFMCAGIFAHHESRAKKGKIPKPATAKASLGDLKKGLSLTIQFFGEHITSSSGWTMLSKRQNLFTVGLIQKTKKNEIVAIPYIIGSIVLGFNRTTMLSQAWLNKREIHIEQVDNFSAVRRFGFPKKADLAILKDLSEHDIKTAFHELLNEPTFKKDWGGESSDLYTCNLKISNVPYSTSIAFKGPSKFRPMKMADLGKNGDQIPRLLNDCSELICVQHCHEITPFVRATLRAYASNISFPRLFLTIDGYQTLRILYAYKKLKVHEMINLG